MLDNREWVFDEAVAGHDEPMAEVAVLLTQEVPFVEESDALGDGDVDQVGDAGRRTDVPDNLVPRSASGRFCHGLIASHMKCIEPAAY